MPPASRAALAFAALVYNLCHRGVSPAEQRHNSASDAPASATAGGGTFSQSVAVLFLAGLGSRPLSPTIRGTRCRSSPSPMVLPKTVSRMNMPFEGQALIASASFGWHRDRQLDPVLLRRLDVDDALLKMRAHQSAPHRRAAGRCTGGRQGRAAVGCQAANSPRTCRRRPRSTSGKPPVFGRLSVSTPSAGFFLIRSDLTAQSNRRLSVFR